MLLQGSHGSVLAQLRHTARQVTDLRARASSIAEQWLGHSSSALEETVSDVEARALVHANVLTLARTLVNERDADAPSALRAHHHGMCLRCVTRFSNHYKKSPKKLGQLEVR